MTIITLSHAFLLLYELYKDILSFIFSFYNNGIFHYTWNICWIPWAVLKSAYIKIALVVQILSLQASCKWNFAFINFLLLHSNSPTHIYISMLQKRSNFLQVAKFFTLSSSCPLRLRNSNFQHLFLLPASHSCFISPITTFIYFITLPSNLMVLFHTCFSLVQFTHLVSPVTSHTRSTASDVFKCYPCCTASGGRCVCALHESRAQVSSLLLSQPHGGSWECCS